MKKILAGRNFGISPLRHDSEEYIFGGSQKRYECSNQVNKHISLLIKKITIIKQLYKTHQNKLIVKKLTLADDGILSFAE